MVAPSLCVIAFPWTHNTLPRSQAFRRSLGMGTRLCARVCRARPWASFSDTFKYSCARAQCTHNGNRTATEDGFCLCPPTSGRRLFGSSAIQFPATELQVRYVVAFRFKIHSYLGRFCSYAHDHSNLEFAQPRHKSQAQYFGGDGFVDTSGPSKSLHFFNFLISSADTPR